MLLPAVSRLNSVLSNTLQRYAEKRTITLRFLDYFLGPAAAFDD